MRALKLIYDSAVQFCDRFLDKRSPLAVRLVLAARSGQQNLVEFLMVASDARSGSVRLEPACLEELDRAFEEFLRERGLRQWAADEPESRAVRALGARSRLERADYSLWLQSTAPGMAANAILILIRLASGWLDEAGSAGARAARSASRDAAPPLMESGAVAPSGVIPGAPSCPRCGKPMALRTARKGARPGSQFWGCAAYPSCKGLRNLE